MKGRTNKKRVEKIFVKTEVKGTVERKHKITSMTHGLGGIAVAMWTMV